MADASLVFIPTDAGWMPDADAAVEAERLVRARFPGAEGLSVRLGEEIVLVDAGAAFEAVACRACGEELALEWWAEAVNAAAEAGFEELAVDPPCCGARQSLNQLEYTAEQGFSRYAIAVLNPGRDATDEDLDALARVLERPVRVVRPQA